MGEPGDEGDVCLLPPKAATVEVPKGAWLAAALEKHPQVLEMYEKVRPLSAAQSFGRDLENEDRTETKETLAQQNMLQLIMEWLEAEGLDKSRAQLSTEARIPFYAVDSEETRLEMLLKLGAMKIQNPLTAHPADDDDQQELPYVDHRPVATEEDVDDDDDAHIWEDKSTDHLVLSDDEKKTVVAASLNKAVERLTPVKEIDIMFKDTFLLTYRSFTTPERLLKKLIERYHVPDDRDSEHRRQVKLRVCAVIKTWLDLASGDINDKLLSMLADFMDSSLSKDGLAQQLRKKLQSAAPSADDMLVNISRDASNPKVPKNIFSPSLALLDIDDEEIARQLTLSESYTIMNIKPVELLNNRWTQPENRHLCANVITLLRRKDRIRDFMIKAIGDAAPGKQRIKTYERFIRIADGCRQLNNFTTLKSLHDTIVHKDTLDLIGKEELSRRSFELLQEIKAIFVTNDSGEYAAYEDIYSRTAPPSLPCVYIVLEKLQRTELLHNNYIRGKLINFEKRSLLFEPVQQIYACRRSPYNLQMVAQIMKVLAREINTEEALIRLTEK